MAEEFGIAFAVVTTSISAIKSLMSAVERYKGRNRTLQRLWDQLNDLVSVLETLGAVAQSQSRVLPLLKGPVERCQQLCGEFERALEEFSNKPRANLLDWAKMEFRKGDINEFMDTLSGYKSTISVGLGTITLQEATATKDILEKYGELIEETTHELNMQLQRINEKFTHLPATEPDSIGTDLKNERAVIESCIRVCEDAMHYLASLSDRERERYTRALADHARNDESSGKLDPFQTHRQTRKLLDDHRDSFAREIGRLQERLADLSNDSEPSQTDERARLQREIEILEKSLDVCKLASGEVNRQRIHNFGEVLADGDSDQVVVTTWAELFTIGKAVSKDSSAQLIGSMTDDSLVQLSKDRYGSRFAAAELSHVDVGTPATQKKVDETRLSGQAHMPVQPSRAVSNEARRRAADIDRTTDHEAGTAGKSRKATESRSWRFHDVA